MIELIKKTVLAGLGATVVTKEAIDRQLEELVKKGKITTDEAKATADKIREESVGEYEKVREETEKFFEEMLQKGNLVTRTQFDALSARVTELEQKHSGEGS